MGILESFNEIILSDSIFFIPDYQRAYAWEEKQIEDLVEDVKGVLDENVEHYLGQLTLKKEKFNLKKYSIYEVIDGQQRITSLILLFMAFAEVYQESKKHLLIEDKSVQKNFKEKYNINFTFENFPILIPSELNRSTFLELANGKDIAREDTDLKTNGNLVYAYNRFRDFMKKTSSVGEEEYWKLVNDLLLMVEFDITQENFIQDDYTATKIFLSLNDRGKPLSILERLKGLFMYYDMKDLEGDLQDEINNNFAEAYKNYDYIISKDDVAKNLRFKEGTLLNYFYHYVWKYLNINFSLDISYDYDKPPESIYDDIRSAIKKLTTDELHEFIKIFVNEFSAFTNAFKELLYQEDNIRLNKIIYMLPLSARPYPLLIGFWKQNQLTEEILSLIEKIDMFIYKARGTDPRAKLYRKVISKIVFLEKNSNVDIKYSQIKEKIEEFLNRFKTSCDERHTQLTKYIFWHYSKIEYDDNYEWLCEDIYEKLEIEHILSLDEENYKDYGFENLDEYEELKDDIGNLTILQERLNKLADDKSPPEKAKIYLHGQNGNEKILELNKELGTDILDAFGNSFNKNHLIERNEKIMEFVKEYWDIDF